MILIVDDESSSRVLLSRVLRAQRYQVRAADGGELALASVTANRPELILLDVRMPGMDGFEVCRRLKADPETRDIPVIFLSAIEATRERVEGFKLGAVDFVTKPFQREELLAHVNTHLALSKLRAHLQGTVEDRTAELRETEQRFRLMANAAPVMIWISNTQKSYTFFNRAWLEFTGRNIEEEIGYGWSIGVHADDLERYCRTYGSAFDQRRSYQIEYRLRRADGQYRWILDSGVPRFVPGGAFTGYIGSCTDITDVKQGHDRLLAVQKLESLGLMAAGIAHEFGNLLTTILFGLDLVSVELSPKSPVREYIENISTLAGPAVEVINLLRTSSGVVADASEMQPLELSSLTEETLRLVKGSISKRASVSTRLPRNIPLVRGNAGQIRQVVMNLLTNASEALGDQEGSISVALEKVHLDPGSTGIDLQPLPQGEYVRLTISDTGCGMSPETRARIFDQFFTTKSLGRGLGLAAVNGIVRSHGGSINVESEPDKGCRFDVLFPCDVQPEKVSVARPRSQLGQL